MDFGLSDEQQQLQQTARDFLTRECPTSFVREVMGSRDGYSRTLHEKMAAMGWTGLVVPEAYGGLGLSQLDLAVLAEELGRAAVPGPFVSSAVLATLAFTHSRARTHQKAWLPRLAAGEALGTVALFEEEQRLDPAGVQARCVATRQGFRLQGTKLFVTDAHVADVIIAAFRSRSRGDDAISLFAVPRDTPGVTVSPLDCVDQTRRPCEVVFEAVALPETALLADERRGWNLMQRLIDTMAVVLAADSLGGAQRVLDLAVEYARTREQFGRPVGSFQAVKHMAAEMVSEIEPVRALVWYAAHAADHEPRRASYAAAMAKARLGDVYTRATNRAVQMHGGIGFTWEHDMHLWFKRAMWNRSAFGDPAFHRERVAKLAGF
jgi:alkylation response protein AidB-like acyl-CoA dehydrogenase